ncbi:hypothetical protein [Roseovarius aquimarinus]|uniref:DUF2802 domain-containing protein n=1 Tax=Roseovarius aquimarinus TaxID=1229156 RepID=A0ABW7I562_9RHOB
MTYIDMIVLGAAGSIILFLPVLVILAAIATWRSSRAHRAAVRAEAVDSARDLRRIGVQVDEMRKDFDWLVSDRMIEQAVSMARTGQPEMSIAQATGISASELDAIAKLRH